ncbi:MAG: nucleoside phosphorylase, partial [Candidatus Bathyarchaeota archaeon]|nr:nucleoside phosphorylase [Candidatus Bathyarchaeota archaeon]
AAFTLEEAIACGAKTIFEVGVSGGLQEFLKPADIVVATEAIRDEGTSHHYFPPEVKVESSPRLRETLIKCLNERKIKHFVGRVWSTDGVYRETLGKFRRFRNSGVLAVNMETSAIFAIAKYRKVEAASAQVISDILTEKGWLQAFYEKSVRENAEVLLKAVLETLSKS